MNGKLGIAIFLAEEHDPRWIYTWVLQTIDAVFKTLGRNELYFYISKFSPCTKTLIHLIDALGYGYELIERPEQTISRYGVSEHLKTHHLTLLVGAKILILSEGYSMDVYMDSLIKSFKPVVLVMPRTGKSLTNIELDELRSSVRQGN